VPNLHLTDLSVRAIKGSDRYATYWDDTTPGFCLRVGLRSKTFCVVRGRSRERLSIGRYPDMSLADARTEAKRLLSTAPVPKQVSMTFASARSIFLAEHYKDAAPRTKYNATKLLERHFKRVEQTQLAALDDTDIMACLDKLAATPSEQLHAYRAVRCFLRWCTRPPRRYIKHSPMEGYQPPSVDRKGTRVLTDDELKAVWNASGTYPHRVLRLMILWGTRNTETCVAERAWVRESVLEIPGEHTKNGRDHSIPLLPLAQQQLDAMPDQARYFFRSRWGDTHLSVTGLAKAHKEVQERSGTRDWQIRDLRRTFRSNMARLKVPRDLCELLINHAPAVLDEIYDRYSYIEEKREALAKYEAFLVTLVSPGEEPGLASLPIGSVCNEVAIEEAGA
jgi:integrase